MNIPTWFIRRNSSLNLSIGNFWSYRHIHINIMARVSVLAFWCSCNYTWDNITGCWQVMIVFMRIKPFCWLKVDLIIVGVTSLSVRLHQESLSTWHKMVNSSWTVGCTIFIEVAICDKRHNTIGNLAAEAIFFLVNGADFYLCEKLWWLLAGVLSYGPGSNRKAGDIISN